MKKITTHTFVRKTKEDTHELEEMFLKDLERTFPKLAARCIPATQGYQLLYRIPVFGGTNEIETNPAKTELQVMIDTTGYFEKVNSGIQKILANHQLCLVHKSQIPGKVCRIREEEKEEEEFILSIARQSISEAILMLNQENYKMEYVLHTHSQGLGNYVASQVLAHFNKERPNQVEVEYLRPYRNLRIRRL